MELARWLVALVYNATVVSLLVALLGLQWLCRACGKRKRADQLEQILSVLYLMQLTTTWLLCLRAFRDYHLADASGTLAASEIIDSLNHEEMDEEVRSERLMSRLNTQGDAVMRLRRSRFLQRRQASEQMPSRAGTAATFRKFGI